MLLSKYCTMINDKNVREGNRKKLFTSQCLTGSLKKSKSNQPYWGGHPHTKLSAQTENVRPISCKIHKSPTLAEISSSNQKQQIAAKT